MFEDKPILEPDDPEDEKEKFIVFDTLALSIEEALTKIKDFTGYLPESNSIGGGVDKVGIFNKLPKLHVLFASDVDG